ncbi:hypothetical protein, partial [Nitrospira sp. BLG_2]|uniref:hypothetical protein n=1 Tax=Nitrospira sp. BLG_2 TaxID=3397507 RepID=UPI003B99D2D6
PKPIRNQILGAVRGARGCQLDKVAQRCPNLTWSEILIEVDAMSRRGQLEVLALGRGDYKLMLPKATRKVKAQGVAPRK